MKIRNSAVAALSLAVLGLSSALATADTKVVASIKPIHSLVASVMQGAGTPDLIVEGASSPHSYALKPSQAKKLETTDVIFWVGHDLETFFEKPVETIGKNAVSVSLLESPGLEKLDFREGGAFAQHADHDEHADHDDHEDHVEHDEHTDHDEHEGHAHSGTDPHIWLDPQNAEILVKKIAAVLAEADPANEKLYADNAIKTLARLETLTTDIERQLEPVQSRAFVVFHDAYRYFERRFGLAAVGSIAINPELAPGADRLAEIRDELRETGAVCVFAEPQFQTRHIATVTEGTDARVGILDPLGAGLEDGPDLYFNLIREMANSMRDCLAFNG
ncbi:MAG: zinc ABC transporter substrate-binding protein ZnuA [Alphaproteobacteria bacterium]